MPIVALPPTTVRAIGSTSIISDPYSLAKELLDNALDASASSVIVEVSQNTVDLIQVKDNGHGIPAADYSLVCKRTFTSKIHTVEDLRNVGGKSLGFRGEALASAAEVSGSLMVSTRAESEPVGSSLKYGRNGELISTERVSHPVGTTVRVSNLFQQIPVRRQTAIKNSKKTLLRIRKMVQSYAMARPSIRFSLKVLKAKSESGNWMYAPGKNATLIEAALKITGTEVASNCITKEWPGSSEEHGSPRESRPNFRLVALLPKLGSDFTRFNNLGQYISIDGRPVSAARGIAQDIVKLYKSDLRFAASRDGLSPTITDPFISIHILCPDGSYDVNVEPSKDDVIFEDQQALLSLVEDLLRDNYGDRSDGHTSEHESLGHSREISCPTGFEALLSEGQPESTHVAHTPSPGSQQGGIVSARSFLRPEPPRRSPPGPKPNLGRHFTLSHSSRASNTSPVVGLQSQRGSFPRRGTESPEIHTSPRETRLTTLPSPVSNLGSPPANTAPFSLSSNRTSPPSPGLSQLSPTTPVRSIRQQQRERDRERYGNGSLDTWFLRLSQASQKSTATENPQTQDTEPLLSQLTRDRFGSEGASPNGAPSPGIESSHSQPVNGTPDPVPWLNSAQKPSRNPAQASSRTINKGQGLPVLEQWSARLYNASNPEQNPELQKALQFEVRKKAAIQERRMQLQLSGASCPTNSPHQSRYLAARAALNSQPDSTMPQSILGDTMVSNGVSKPVLGPHDPRAYLMRLQTADGPSSSKLRRITSSKLPFEKIPEEYDLHDLSLTWPADVFFLQTSLKETSKEDLYTKSGDQIEAFTSANMNAAADIWNDRLSDLTRAHYRSTDDSNIPILQFDFSGISRISNDGSVMAVNT
ncbi:hypothetical protein BJX76DRAFT_365383 [Aspergillus varians]